MSSFSDYTLPVSLRSSPPHNAIGLGSFCFCFKTKNELGDLAIRHIEDQTDSPPTPVSFIFPISSPCLNPWVLRSNVGSAFQMISATVDPRAKDTKILCLMCQGSDKITGVYL